MVDVTIAVKDEEYVALANKMKEGVTVEAYLQSKADSQIRAAYDQSLDQIWSGFTRKMKEAAIASQMPPPPPKG